MPGKTYLTLQTPQKARELWLTRVDADCGAPGIEKIAIEQSAGRIIAVPIAAERSSPAFHGAAMDGVAVNAEITFAANPRKPLNLELGKDAFSINTGRPLPAGTNAVIMTEHVNFSQDGRFASIERAAFPWQHVRKTGEDMVETEILLAPGTRIGPYELGAMAAAGVLRPTVFKKARVAIIPSGSDLVPMREASLPDVTSGHTLPEFNSLIFAAMFEEAGAEPEVKPIVADDPKAIIKAIREAMANADLIVLNAGTSAGSYDFTAEVLQELGQVMVHGVAIMPGKPTVLGILNPCADSGNRYLPVIGAPGYPVSATIAIEEFALPLLARWQKRPPLQRECIEVFPCNPLPSRPGMEERVRVKLGNVDGNIFAVPLPRGAGTVSSLARADAIITIAPQAEGLEAARPVQASLLRPKPQIDGALLAIGSHDNALELIDSMLRRQFPGFSLTSAHVGSIGGLIALAKGQCHLAGSHLLDPDTGIYNQAAIRQQLKNIPVALIRLADREQGFMVRPGNPLNITKFEDLAQGDVIFVNRQIGSGTRMLLDYELKKRGIDPRGINGYADEEYTHMNVAADVLSGRADIGLGVRAAANALGLDFVPVGMEQYDLVIPLRYLQDERMAALLAIIRSAAFKKAVCEMGGYGLEQTGEVIWEYDGQ